jgi:hypothetical protein
MNPFVDRSRLSLGERGGVKLSLVLLVAALVVLAANWYGAELERYGSPAAGAGKSAQLLRQLKADSRTLISAVRFLMDFDRGVAPMPGEPTVPGGLPDVAMPTNGVAGAPRV